MSGKKTRKRVLPYRQYIMVTALFTLAGSLAGYVYFLLVGCRSGACMITSSPLLSTIWGGLLGYLLIGFFFVRDQEEEKQSP